MRNALLRRFGLWIIGAAAAAACVACGPYSSSTPTTIATTRDVPEAVTTPIPPVDTATVAVSATEAPNPPATAVAPPNTPAPPRPTNTAVPDEPPPGQHYEGGSVASIGRLTIHLPNVGEFIIGIGTGDPGGAFVLVYHVSSGSRLFLNPQNGHEIERRATTPEVNSTFDQIDNTVEVAP